jgi:uncharacterized membrane protein
MNLTISGILSRSWKAFTSNIGTWLLIDLVFVLLQVPQQLNNGIPTNFNFSNPQTLEAMSKSQGSFGQTLLSWIFSIIAVYFSFVVARYAYSHLDGKKIAFKDAVSFTNFWAYFFNGILVGLILVPFFLVLVGLGIGVGVSTLSGLGEAANVSFAFTPLTGILLFLVFVVFGFVIWVASRLSFASYYAIFTDSGAINSITKSWKVTKGHVWTIILLSLTLAGLFILSLIPLLLGLLIWFPIAMLTMVDIYKQISSKSTIEEVV